MRGLMRLLFMFGPMILRQVQKYQRNKERQQYQQSTQRRMPQEAPRRRQTPPPPPPKPELSEEEKNFRLKEEDIMLDNETIQDYNGRQTASHEIDHEPPAPEAPQQIEAPDPKPSVDEEHIVPSGDEKKEEDGFNLKDLFFEEDEEDKK